MLASVLSLTVAFGGLVAAQSPPSVVCIAGQCLQGFTNLTLGAKLSAPGAPTDLLLLPGQYTSTTNPQFLHDILTASSASLSPSPGFDNASLPLPLNLQLSTGLALFADSGYSGQSAFVGASETITNTTAVPLSAKSVFLSSSVQVTINAGSNNRIVLWDSVPDMAQLPTANSSLSITGIQSSACSPTCAGAGVCSASGTCVCAPGFAGASCEECDSGFFGPSCQPCPEDCDDCDQGISGSGRCLSTTIANDPKTCNCVNGVCASDGSCTCNDGWTTSDDGRSCAKCASGFYSTSSGDCKLCEPGCGACADTTAICSACLDGFTLDTVSRQKCLPNQMADSAGRPCPRASFSNGGVCQACDSSCQACSGPTARECTECAAGQYFFNGACVSASQNGICTGTRLIADNRKGRCDACDSKCTECTIPGFTTLSQVETAQCTKCIPGTFLANGRCVDTCPDGSFPSNDGVCTQCDSSCSTCGGSATFCLTCPSGQVSANGKCVSSCPTSTFPSRTFTGRCDTCHPDCATCDGSSAFDKCLTCPPERPVLSNGRCLTSCAKNQYLDPTTRTCQQCDTSCSSCSGSGSSSCLACSSSTQMLQAGSCVAANCGSDGGSNEVLPGLGVCFNLLVTVPKPSGTATPTPLPSITGLTTPTAPEASKRPLEWWQILLMALGCAFIFLVILMCWRRRARKQRAKRTAQFADAKALTPEGMSRWRWRLIKLRERMFGHKSNNAVRSGNNDIELGESEDAKVMRLKLLADAKYERDMDKLISSYQDSLQRDKSWRASRAPTTVTSSMASRSNRSQHVHHHHHHHTNDLLDLGSEPGSRLSSGSLYSQVTGIPRRGPESKQPVRDELKPIPSQAGSRFSASSWGTSYYHQQPETLAPPPPKLTPAQSYAEEVRPGLEPTTTVYPIRNYWLDWLEPTPTGTSSNSKNPFRNQ